MSFHYNNEMTEYKWIDILRSLEPIQTYSRGKNSLIERR